MRLPDLDRQREQKTGPLWQDKCTSQQRIPMSYWEKERMKLRTLLLIVVVFALALPAVAGTLGPYNYTWTGTESTLNPRLFRDGIPSTAANKAFPGTLAETDFYTTWTFTNTGPSEAVAVIEVEPGGSFFSFLSVYQGFFDPTNLATNYLGDGGVSGSTSFVVTVAGFQSFVLVANSVDYTNAIGHSFNFEISGNNIVDGARVPEPASFMLIGSGLIAFALRRMRR